MTGSERRPRLLLVEDDPAAMLLVKKLLSIAGQYEIETAVDGAEGLQKARQFVPDLVISDYMMPEMNGIELCQAIKADASLGNPIFMMLSALSESDRKAKGLEMGADEYLGKPPIPEELVPKVNAFLRIKRLQDQLRADAAELAKLNRKLEDSFLGLVRLVTRLIDVRVPGARERGDISAAATTWIAQKLAVGEAQQRDLAIASHLRELGKIGLPEKIARKSSFEVDMNEWPTYARHPIIAETALADNERLKGVAMILRSQLENMDGTGYPDHLTGNEIPLPSRILRCVSAYADYRARVSPSLSHRDAIEAMASAHPGVFDPAALQLFGEYLTVSEDASWMVDKRAITVAELTSGMRLAADLITGSGVKLLPEGTRLTERMVEHIQNHHANDPIVASVVIWREDL